ncbi:DapH/DapD/GlmU-related protein [Rhodococcus sp. (in: high G+C Gram-positive bacteria)]|uniref:acyltransferase n=1 Tax=Rhodococcus sp. TaxID=1831 RepID=UPI0025810E7D|nr:DapH/DapD/GlmU-related protein [Rhodococcus sp. (in: high G+C Gram-positive bacteria)]
MGMNIQKSSIQPDVFFGGTNMKIGNGVRINRGVFLDNSAHISIGEECSIGLHAMLCTSTHEIDYPRRAGEQYGKPIHIGSGSWIGANVTIQPGVTIGPGCIIAAGSVVTADCEANGLYAGMPAQRKRDLSVSA